MKSKNVLILIGILAVIGIGVYLLQSSSGNGLTIVKCKIGHKGCAKNWGLCGCEWFPKSRILDERERLMSVSLKNETLIFDSEIPFPKDSVDYFEIDPNQILEGTSKLKARQFLLKEGKYEVQKTSKGGSRVVIPVTVIK
jgi:hypothetical protein